MPRMKLSTFLIKRDYIEIELNLVVTGHYEITNSSINDIPLCLIVDSGASMSVLNQELEDKFKWIIDEPTEDEQNSEDTKVAGYGAISDGVEFATINKLQLGEIILDNIKVGLIDFSHINQAYTLLNLPPIDGIIGADLLKNYKAIIDYSSDKLYLKE